MDEITLEELEESPEDAFSRIDIRESDEFRRGSLPGAVNIPESELSADAAGALRDVDRGKAAVLISHTGLKSRALLPVFREAGIRTVNLDGGWRSFLARKLGQEAADPELPKRTAEIERSIIKKYRRPIWRKFTKAVHDYQLIQEGDRIACCISGGKDSMLLAKLLQELQRHGRVPFELVFLTMNPGYNEQNWSIVRSNAKILGLDLKVFDSDIFNAVAKIDRNPCYLCARMRRGNLYANARDLGCNKIALGHHFDDVVETILMGMFFAGKFETMMPKLHSKNFPGMELIRPLYLVHEQDIKAWRDYNRLYFIQCACRFTENVNAREDGSGSRRQDMKKLVAELRKMDPTIDQNIFNSTRNVSLKTIMGYHTDKWSYQFLDDYDARGAEKPGRS